MKRGTAKVQELLKERSRTVVGVFDASSGKAIAKHYLTDPKSGARVVLPAKCIIKDAYYLVETTFTDGDADAATIALSYDGANNKFVSVLAISDASNVWAAGIRGTLIDNPTLGTDAANGDTAIELAAIRAATKINIASDTYLTATVAVAALTAGKLKLFVEIVEYD
jgi:hypothetical protein